MLHLVRIYRFTKMVKKKIRDNSRDHFLRGFEGGISLYVPTKQCLDDFKVLSADRNLVARQTLHSAIDGGYLDSKGNNLKPSEKGFDLIEGYGWGLMREFITKEWKFVTLGLPVISFVIGLYADTIKHIVTPILKSIIHLL